MSNTKNRTDLLTLTAEIVGAHVANNKVAVSEVAALVDSVHGALARLGVAADPEPAQQKPAVPVRSSIKPDYIVCLEDGTKAKMLKQHLRIAHGLTPDGYRAKWKLPSDYPVVAPGYAAQRRSLALKTGLGRKVSERVKPTPTPATLPKKGRPPRATSAPASEKEPV